MTIQQAHAVLADVRTRMSGATTQTERQALLRLAANALAIISATFQHSGGK